ncbi:MAG: hypothetical protein ACK47B_23800 [Armatimonadota bacterium]
MARLKAVEISEELRTALAAQAFDGFTLASIPTGRDPRRFTEHDLLPQAVVLIGGTGTVPRGVGGATEAVHTLTLYLLFAYADGDDINLLKLSHGAELFDWLADHKSGTNYKLFINDGGGGPGMPEIDYEPDEELVYVASGQNIAVIKLECGVRQRPFFAL